MRLVVYFSSPVVHYRPFWLNLDLHYPVKKYLKLSSFALFRCGSTFKSVTYLRLTEMLINFVALIFNCNIPFNCVLFPPFFSESQI